MLTKFRPHLGRSFTLRAATYEREETDGCCVADLAGTRLIPPRFAGRKTHLRPPVARKSEVPSERAGPPALRRDRWHARPLRPPRLPPPDHGEARPGSDPRP